MYTSEAHAPNQDRNEIAQPVAPIEIALPEVSLGCPPATRERARPPNHRESKRASLTRRLVGLGVFRLWKVWQGAGVGEGGRGLEWAALAVGWTRQA